jgi:hypothetical protein
MSEGVLRSGDVISLAGVQVVFMIDENAASRPGSATDTQVMTRLDDEPED